MPAQGDEYLAQAEKQNPGLSPTPKRKGEICRMRLKFMSRGKSGSSYSAFTGLIAGF